MTKARKPPEREFTIPEKVMTAFAEGRIDYGDPYTCPMARAIRSGLKGTKAQFTGVSDMGGIRRRAHDPAGQARPQDRQGPLKIQAAQGSHVQPGRPEGGMMPTIKRTCHMTPEEKREFKKNAAPGMPPPYKGPPVAMHLHDCTYDLLSSDPQDLDYSGNGQGKAVKLAIKDARRRGFRGRVRSVGLGGAFHDEIFLLDGKEASGHFRLMSFD
jgi:hypothetical protein